MAVRYDDRKAVTESPIIKMNYLAESLRPLATPIADLHEDPANARKGHAIDRIAASLKQYGQRKPIVVNRLQGNKVEAGNGTLAAAKSLGWTEIAAVFVDDDAATAAAYGIADNRVGEFSQWDAEILADLMPTLDGLVTGFTKDELNAILPVVRTEGDTEPQIDKAEELRAKWGVESGQMWQLGDHRIICGDCTDAAVVARVMDGEKAQLVFTDPPYGVAIGAKNRMLNSFQPSGRNLTDIEDDALSPDDLKAQLLPAFVNIRQMVMAEDCTVFVTAPQGGELGMMMMMMKEAGLTVRHVLIWKKNQPTFSMGRLDYDYKHEPILLTWGKRHKRPMLGEHRTSVWEIDKPRASADHPTMKPVALVENALLNNSDAGDTAFDAYSGSGTTLIACENLGRKCRAIEISPGYVAVAIERWAQHTGREPELL